MTYNLIILSAGRSGSSMIAGMLAAQSRYLGDNYIPPRCSNPKGFFEDSRVNAINERIIRESLCYRIGLRDLREGQLWLARLPAWIPLRVSHELQQEIRLFAERQPFCLKDPRFAYTFPAWRSAAPNMRYIVVFRHPATTAASIVHECASVPYLNNVKINHIRASAIWLASYRAILRHYRQGGDWLFVHVDQMFTPFGLSRLTAFVDGGIDGSFPDHTLQRSSSNFPVQRACLRMYDALCSLAQFRRA